MTNRVCLINIHLGRRWETCSSSWEPTPTTLRRPTESVWMFEKLVRDAARRQKRHQLKVRSRRRQQKKMLPKKRRRTMGSELSFFNLGFESLSTCRTWHVRKGRASSHKKTTWARTTTRQAAVRLQVPIISQNGLKWEILNLGMKGIWKISNQPQIRLKSVEILKWSSNPTQLAQLTVILRYILSFVEVQHTSV